MKIKTITCHNVYNTGASLQAYALVTYLKECGHNVEIIDYVPEYLKHYRLFGAVNPIYDKPVLKELYQLLKLPSRLKARYGRRKGEFDRFTKKNLPLTKVHYDSFEELCKNPPEADLIFAGSDQIWNTLFQNGKDPAFYLQFAPANCIRASYAASFATENIVEEWTDKLRVWLSEFNYISVREQTGIRILNELNILNAVQVVDPVFLLTREHWEKMSEICVFSEKYIFLYDFDNNRDIEQYVKIMAKKNGWKIYSFFKNSYAHKCFKDEGPEVFLALINQAQLVVSNSFHATAFSLIFHKQFVVFNRIEGINTRMQDLLRVLGVEKQLIDVRNDKIENLNIDYLEVSEKMEAVIWQSEEFIFKVIEKTKERYEEKDFICD